MLTGPAAAVDRQFTVGETSSLQHSVEFAGTKGTFEHAAEPRRVRLVSWSDRAANPNDRVRQFTL
jgi:hypothetical protein